eukprot:CAMPEP_0201936394 /NCGR_PEP_ID=MMETSP0903-20130614/37408_1 /ASSEMBLY_ACC=CAM_ASM_000552 /TAXON_ID=420261 /ORGANISM="Thalassiosira antarctica, Strain CCMP982" /LENGTH=132 /DNA_ID=CAMNT_0048477075 /DNA_START=503 /DNA_END=902 /DNA_ORIENTATION=+
MLLGFILAGGRWLGWDVPSNLPLFKVCLSSTTFHSKWGNKGCTITNIETTGGFVVGGYSDATWNGSNSYSSHDTSGIHDTSNKSFFFALSRNGIMLPCKMKLTSPDNSSAAFFANGQPQNVIIHSGFAELSW